MGPRRGIADVELRETFESDLAFFFRQQQDRDANQMAAFGAADPDDFSAFQTKWARIRHDPTGLVRTITIGREVAGSVMLWRDPDLPGPEVSCWIGSEYWGQGVASRALAAFLRIVRQRPLYGRAAHDNIGSVRVLQKAGFRQIGDMTGYSAFRGEQVRELLFRFD